MEKGDNGNKEDEQIFAFALPPPPPAPDPGPGHERRTKDRGDTKSGPQYRYDTSTPPLFGFNLDNHMAADNITVHEDTTDIRDVDKSYGSLLEGTTFVHSSEKSAPESTLFTTNIPAITPIAFHSDNTPPTDHTFNSSAPNLAISLSPLVSPTFPTLGNKSPALITNQKPAFSVSDHKASSTITTSDPFGTTWAALQQSKKAAEPRLNHLKTSGPHRHMLFMHATKSKPKTPRPAMTSPIPATNSHTKWVPSFPEARVPNHRNAPIPAPIRSNFLGSSNPLITADAIAEAAHDAEMTLKSMKPLERNTMNGTETNEGEENSIHVRFCTPACTNSTAGTSLEIGFEDPDLNLENVTRYGLAQHEVPIKDIVDVEWENHLDRNKVSCAADPCKNRVFVMSTTLDRLFAKRRG